MRAGHRGPCRMPFSLFVRSSRKPSRLCWYRLRRMRTHGQFSRMDTGSLTSKESGVGEIYAIPFAIR